MSIYEELTGGWELAWTEPGERPDNSEWIEAAVPGEVHLDLFKAGIIPDPYYGTNFFKCMWMEKTDFWYRKSFEVPAEYSGKQLILEFKGLDNFADIWLDEQHIASTRNMFVAHEFDLTSRLRPGHSHELLIRLSGPISYVNKNNYPELPMDVSTIPSIFNMPWRHYSRKMQMSYGWDNVPRLPTTGIFRPVLLKAVNRCRIKDVHLSCELQGDSANVYTAVELQRYAAAAGLQLRYEVRDQEGNLVLERETAVADNHATDSGCIAKETLTINQPRLWWPHQLGEPHLYTVSVSVWQEGQQLDVSRQRYGLRTIRVITEPAQEREVTYRVGRPGGKPTLEMDGGDAGAWSRVPLDEPQTEQVSPFRFEVNGQPIFIKGVNWQPADCFLPQVTKQKYEVLLRRVKEANLNMVRIWGGGIVEDDYFYDLCDELGLLLWQDFFFACAIYPQEDWFAREIEAEARYVIKKLRNRTSLAIWCGDNEGDMFNTDQGKDPVAANRLTHAVIPGLLEQLDPARYYHPSSPSGGRYPRSPWAGDKRNWGAFYPKNFYDHIRNDEGRFISEGGSYSLPGMRTIEMSIPEEQRWPVETSEAWYYHLGNVPGHHRGFETKMSEYVRAYFGEPKDLPDYIWLSQYAQANGYKAFAENFRRRKYECDGFQIWKYCDTWPSGEMTVVDYCLENKVSYYYLKRACEPLIASFKYVEDGFEYWIVNDTLQEWQGTLQVSAVNLMTGQAHLLMETAASAAADSSTCFGKASWTDLQAYDTKRYALVARLEAGGKVITRNIQFIDDSLKDLVIPEPAADYDVKLAGTAWQITVRAHTFIRDVGVTMEQSDPALLTYSDNHFAMLPGEEVTVTVTGAQSGDRPQIQLRGAAGHERIAHHA
ncbi:beta-mannosidase [Paenibacillus sp. 1P07SE]|uniref:beta-mannosidase n=1 Tax=Paenibacillus sp. 1P07SE TaxID=3132209 RepID=UPI0039A58380